MDKLINFITELNASHKAEFKKLANEDLYGALIYAGKFEASSIILRWIKENYTPQIINGEDFKIVKTNRK